MKYYETLLIVRQEATEAQIEALTDELVALLEEKGGKISRRENWGLRSLAYRIRKNRKGHYILLNYESSSEAVDVLQYKMRYSETILRYMTIRTDDLPTDASINMRKNDDSEDTVVVADDRSRVQDRGYRPRAASSSENADDKPDTNIESEE